MGRFFSYKRNLGRILVGIAGRAFSGCRYGYRGWLVHFGSVRFLAAIPTEDEGDGEDAGNGADDEGMGAALRKRIGFAAFSAGSTLGLKCGSRSAAAPDCAKEPKVEAALRPLWTLFIWFAAWVHFTGGGSLEYNERQLHKPACTARRVVCRICGRERAYTAYRDL